MLKGQKWPSQCQPGHFYRRAQTRPCTDQPPPKPPKKTLLGVISWSWKTHDIYVHHGPLKVQHFIGNDIEHLLSAGLVVCNNTPQTLNLTLTCQSVLGWGGRFTTDWLPCKRSDHFKFPQWNHENQQLEHTNPKVLLETCFVTPEHTFWNKHKMRILLLKYSCTYQSLRLVTLSQPQSPWPVHY